jgi:hypothetical protein
MLKPWTVPLAALLWISALHAGEAAAVDSNSAESARRTGPTPYIDPAVVTDGFLAAHPDMMYRQKGVDLFHEGKPEAALKALRRAARYADKPSQAMIGEMYWNGSGTPRDRALGFAWMFLAAERNYSDFAAWRDFYWSQMDEVERGDAKRRGVAIMAEYRDRVAKPRLETLLRREERKATGSLLGYSGASQMVIVAYKNGKPVTIDPETYYARKYWQPEAYWKLQDEIWTLPLKGRVDVGDLEMVRDSQRPTDGTE